MTISENKQDQL